MLTIENSQPLNKEEFEDIIKKSLRLDLDGYFVGGIDRNEIKENKALCLLVESGHDLHTEPFYISEKHAYIYAMKEKSPARYSFYREKVRKNPNIDITFPRTSAKNYSKKTIMFINRAQEA